LLACFQQNEQGSDNDDAILQCAFTNDPVMARRDALTAAVLVVVDDSSSSSKAGQSLQQQFESLFRASLTYRDSSDNELLAAMFANQQKMV